MADTVDEGGAVWLDPDACVVVNRAEAIAELSRAHAAHDRLAYFQGLVAGLIIASIAAGAIWLLGWSKGDAPWFAASFATSGLMLVLGWRLWDASDCEVSLMGWELKTFAARLKTQWEEEAQHG